MTRLLITGGSGFVGLHLLRAAPHPDIVTTYHTRPFTPPRGQAVPLDLRDEAAVRALLTELRPDAILHTACSNRNADHIAGIAPAARALAHYARETGARLVHLSSDVLFDGEHAPYSDEAIPRPITAYARAKAEAERLVAEIEPRAAIVRPSLVWGLDPLDHQTGWLVEGLRRGETVTLFTDEFRSPVYVHDLVSALLELVERPDLAGAINLGGAQRLNRWEFGARMLAALGIPLPPTLIACTVAEAGRVRPRDCTMVSARAARELKTPLRGVDEVLNALGRAAVAPSPARAA
jgi:dTDP-4-dehydrorhamnose reductase